MNLPGALLRFFFDGALRLHAARRAHVANVHEMARDRSASFWFHRLMTAGTLNDRRFAHLACVAINPYNRLLSAGSVEEAIPAWFLAHETRLIGVI